jgi:magnesium transporter
MTTICHYTPEGLRRISIKDFHRALQSNEGVLWVDMENPDEAEDETILVSLLDFHPLSIEDARRGSTEETHLPKVDEFPGYLFVVFSVVEALPGAGGSSLSGPTICTRQLSAYITSRVLVTHHYQPLRSIGTVNQFLSKNPELMKRGPDYLFHLIIDDVVDHYTPILDSLDDSLDRLEKDVFHSPKPRTMAHALQMKRTIMTMRRIAFYQREMLNRLSRGEFELISTNEMVYYRNVYDHLVRMTDIADTYRDMISGLLDAYLSVTSNRLNQVMKVLTIISTIFLPLSFITGFFGMNFSKMPGLDWEHGTAMASGIMLLVAVVMLWVFRRNRWM